MGYWAIGYRLLGAEALAIGRPDGRWAIGDWLLGDEAMGIGRPDERWGDWNEYYNEISIVSRY